LITKIPITYQWKDLKDEIGLRSNGAALVDGIIDDVGGLSRRPTLVDFCDLGLSSPVDGLFWSDAQKKAYAVAGGKIYRIDSAGTATDITGTCTPSLGQKCYFADYSTTAAYMANGAKIIKLPDTGNATELSDPQWPTTIRSVAVADQYLLALPASSDQVYYSEVTAPESSVGEFFTAENRPDLVQSFGWENGVLSLFGESTTETWYDDGVTPWTRYSAGNLSRGWLSKHGQICANSVWYGVDQSRQISRLTGGAYQPVSLAMNRYLSSFSDLSDAEGAYLEVDGRPYILWTFPTAQISLVYDLLADGFSEWGLWRNGDYKPFLGRTSCVPKPWGAFTLVGDRTQGKIYKLTSDNEADADDPVRTTYRTPWLDFGAPNVRKTMPASYWTIRQPQSSTQKTMMVRWRDNGRNDWGRWVEVKITQGTDAGMRAYLTGLGSFYSRQFEIAVTDNAKFYLVGWEVELG